MDIASRHLYEVKIDFDESSIAWRANKKNMGNGHFKYKCLQKFLNFYYF